MKNFTLYFSLLFISGLDALAQPTVPASNMTFSSLEGGSFRVNWTNGNGARRIVIARQGSAVTATPVNGVDYNHNGNFGSGDVISPGQFVVADVTTNFADVSGLMPSTTYHFAVFEYNGTGAATQYLTTPLNGSNATLSAPTTQASGLVFSNIVGSAVRLDFTAGNGQRRLVVARQASAVNANPSDLTAYSAGTIFGSGSQIGTGNYVVLNSNGTNVTVTGLLPSTTYHFAVFEYNGLSTPVYMVPAATASVTTAPRPTIAASAPFGSSVEGNTMRMNWTSGNGNRRIVVARQGSAVTAVPVDGIDYTHNNSFGSGDDLGGNQFVVFDGTTNFVDLTNLSANTVYHFRVYEYDGSGTNTAYLTSSFATASQSTLSPPSIQASAMGFSNISGSALTVTWTNGNGARRIVVARQGGPVNADPSNFTFYSASTIFGSGSQIGTGNYVMFNGATGSSVNITGLSINTTYHFAIYEFNGIGGAVYLTPGLTGSITTPAQPTVAATGMNFSSIEGNTMRVNWTSGNGARRIVVARAGSAVTALPSDGMDYNHNAAFGSGDAISPGQFVVFDGTGAFVDLTGLAAATVYHFAVFEYNGTGTNTAYLTAGFPSASQSTLTPPTTQASAMGFSNISGSALTVTWTNGNGARRIVVARQGGPVNADPSNFTFYSASTIFGSGSQIGTGNYVVFNGASGSSVNITGLSINTTYHFAIYEFNGVGGAVYLVPALTGSISTAAQPTIPPTAMTFSSIEGTTMRVNWTNGNGTRRIVVGRQGSAVTAVPANGTDYNSSSIFGAGDAIAPGQFVVFDGTQNFVDLSALAHSTTYHFAVYEYDGTGTGTSYLTTALTGSQSTVSAPSLQASNLSFSSVAATSVTVNWTVGNGERRIVVARQGSPVNADPVNLTGYSASNAFGLGTQIGSGNYVVSTATGSSFNLSGLISGTTYHFAVYEYNGVSGPVYLTPGLTGSVTTPGAPQIQSANAAAANITTTTMQLNWVNGSGNRRLVLMKQGGAVDANPVDNTAYTANSFLGSGTQLGTGNYAVYDGTGSSVIVTNLQSNTTYHFAVFEYNSFGAASMFLLTNPARGNAATSVALPVLLVDFKAYRKDGNIQLEWSTASEENSSHFEIQKSRDGGNYVTIETIAAKGNSAETVNYSYLDDSPYDGISFYRLRQVDKDGSYAYSPIVRIAHEVKGLVKKIVNPLTNSLFVQLTTATTGEWRLYDFSGRLLKKDRFSGNTIQHDLSTLPNASYVFEIITAVKKERILLIKTNQ